MRVGICGKLFGLTSPCAACCTAVCCCATT